MLSAYAQDCPHGSERPVKRVKTSTTTRGNDDDNDNDNDNDHVDYEEDSTLVRRHPLGVRPSGNALTSDWNLKSSCGPFARLPDDLLMQLLETLNIPHLLRLGNTCRALYAFTRSEELWRALFVE